MTDRDTDRDPHGVGGTGGMSPAGLRRRVDAVADRPPVPPARFLPPPEPRPTTPDRPFPMADAQHDALDRYFGAIVPAPTRPNRLGSSQAKSVRRALEDTPCPDCGRADLELPARLPEAECADCGARYDLGLELNLEGAPDDDHRVWRVRSMTLTPAPEEDPDA